jgi:aminoglycoside phosphotransferase family enzyme
VLRVDGPGIVHDWLVVMRQLPREHMLDRRLAAGTAGAAELARVAATLAGFYRTLPPEPLAPDRYLAAVRGRLEEAVAELARPEFGLPPTAVAALREGLEAALRRVAGQLAARATGKCIVEGHGDLRAEHVCIEPPVRIIDALEFDRGLRVLDRAEDVATLQVDLVRLGFRAAAETLGTAFAEAAADRVEPALAAFYLALRAATRAKVAIWHLDDAGRYPEAAPWQRRALEFVALARDWAEAAATRR